MSPGKDRVFCAVEGTEYDTGDDKPVRKYMDFGWVHYLDGKPAHTVGGDDVDPDLIYSIEAPAEELET